jgi:hypothetical protein
LAFEEFERSGMFPQNTLPPLPSDVVLEYNLYVDFGKTEFDSQRYVVTMTTYGSIESYRELFDQELNSPLTINRNCYYFQNFTPKVCEWL